MIAVIVYHRNIFQIYEPEWIRMFKESILNQTRMDFVIYEINYGGSGERLFQNSLYYSMILPNFVHAMNFLIDKSFEDGATVVYNTNCDDHFSLERIEKQQPYIDIGYDIVASNFCLVKDSEIVHTHKFDQVDIKSELNRGHNVIGHPVVAMSKSFWGKNRYDPEEVPEEDIKLWQRAIHNSSFIILPDMLLYHRIHSNSVCQSQNR